MVLSFYKSRGGDIASQAHWEVTDSGDDDGTLALILLARGGWMRTPGEVNESGAGGIRIVSDDCRRCRVRRNNIDEVL